MHFGDRSVSVFLKCSELNICPCIYKLFTQFEHNNVYVKKSPCYINVLTSFLK